MRLTRIVFVLSSLLFLLASPVQAISCREWDRMGAGQKSATIDRMIQSTVSGSGGREYRVDRGAIARCLQGYARSIGYDFDGACTDARTASMQALNRIFKDYIWTCAG
jgi:hypothetical protein